MLPSFIAVDFVESGDNGGARKVVTKLDLKPTSDFHHAPAGQPHVHDEL